MENTRKFIDAISPYKSTKKDYYEIVVHVDGTYDNIARLFLLKHIFKLNILSVTFNHQHYQEYQKKNIKKLLEVFDIDNFMMTPRRKILAELQINKNQQLKIRTDFVATINIASKYNIPLMLDNNNLVSEGNILQLIDNQNIAFYDDLFSIEKYLSDKINSFDLTLYKIAKPITKHNLLNINELLVDYQVEIKDFIVVNHFIFDDNLIEDIKENQSFWLGSPDDFDANEIKKIERKSSIYEDLAKKSPYGEPLYKDTLEYCTRCCMPVTAEALKLDELGICQPCQSSEQKMHINWIEREKGLQILLEKYSSKTDYYDCIVPISGGKDSTFQLYVLTEIYKRRVLAVTFSHNWYSKTGRYNLYNSISKFDVDHLMFTPRRKAISLLARKSLYMIGDSCWHCHAGVGAFPLQAAVKWKVSFLIWGESIAENSGRATYQQPTLFDRDYFTKISARYYAEDMISENEGISSLDVVPYKLPSVEEILDNAVKGIHLGDYIFWDDERQMEFVRDNFDWREDKVEGTYKKYKSVECIMAGVHDYSKFVKRGFGRATDHASQDVKNGLLSREEGFELAKKYDSERPDALTYYLNLTGYTEEEFEQILKDKREGTGKDLP